MNFVAQPQSLTVLSGTAPILHFELRLPSQRQEVTVSAESAQSEIVTPSTLVDRVQSQETPGASRSNSLSMITDFVPGAYLVHDQLHIRGGHPMSWLIDGVPIPNTNIASNLGPQIDPKDIDALEVQRGSYSANYGDRTYGIFDVVPRTGFERNNEAELTLSAGDFYQTDDQLNFGGHSNRFAYYASLNGNRTSLGLEPPTTAVIHDAANGFGGFTSLIYNADPKDQFRFVGQSRRDFYQVPFDPNDPSTQGQFLHDANRESDSFAVFSWVRTLNPGLVITVSPFYHHNSANYGSSPQDFPSLATEKRASQYAGGQTTLSWVEKRNNLRGGLYGFAQEDDQTFGLVCNDPSQTQCQGSPSSPLSEMDNPSGSQLAAYAEDQIKATSWLTLNAGVRQTHFSGGVVENATSPRVGASLRVPKLNWVFRGFYGHFYQAPPLLTVSGPLNQLALGCGGINGGLTDFSFGGGCGLLDHDQRHTLHIGSRFSLPWRLFAFSDVYYASGFTNGGAPQMSPGDHLQPHTTFDLSLSRSFGERFSASLQALNVANRRVLLDNSFTFGGTHYINPREIFVQLRYRFHY